MPQKDPEAYRKYKREQMARRRAEAKKKSEPTNSQGAKPPAPFFEQAAPISTVAPLETEALESTAGNLETAEPRPAQPAPESNESLLVKARRLAELTREWLDKRGWVMWECPRLNDQRIIIIRDETITGYPVRYPVFTELDLEKIGDLPDSTFKLILEAKKQAACRLL